MRLKRELIPIYKSYYVRISCPKMNESGSKLTMKIEEFSPLSKCAKTAIFGRDPDFLHSKLNSTVIFDSNNLKESQVVE